MDGMSSTNVTEISFDTNILFYGFDRRDVTKHRIANVVLDRCFAPDNPIAMQVLAEFYRSAARKLVRPEAAKAIVEDYLQGMRVIARKHRICVQPCSFIRLASCSSSMRWCS